MVKVAVEVKEELAIGTSDVRLGIHVACAAGVHTRSHGQYVETETGVVERGA